MPKKLSYDVVKNYIESYEYVLLSDSYVNNATKLKVRCDKGHEYEVTFGNFQQGWRCPVCKGNKISKKQTFSYNKVKQYIENENYVLLSDTYKNSKTKLKVRCDKGHEYEVKFNDFQQGIRCPVCAGTKKHDYNYVKQYIEKEGYTLLSKSYKNNSIKLKVRCDKGHEYEVKFRDFKNGNRCPVCNSLKTSSKAEIEVADLVKKLLPENKVLCNDRTQIINPLTGYYLELDVFVPDLNKAIEFNGNYWHSLPKAIVNDKIKKEQCKEKDINLLVINENEWINNREKIIKELTEFIIDN